MAKRSFSLKQLPAAAFGGPRRLNKLNDCDCVRCFGFCTAERDKEQRHARLPRPDWKGLRARRDGAAQMVADGDELMTAGDRLDAALYSFDPVKHYEDEPLAALLIFEQIQAVLKGTL